MASRLSNLAPPGSLLKVARPVERPRKSIRSPRERNDKHLAAIRLLPCLSCEGVDRIEAAHVQMTSAAMGKRPGGIGHKRDDCWTLPLCSRCHTKQHRLGEQAFWSEIGINPILAAHALWIASPDPAAMLQAWRKIVASRGR
jgi:hypothetical protein